MYISQLMPSSMLDTPGEFKNETTIFKTMSQRFRCLVFFYFAEINARNEKCWLPVHNHCIQCWFPVLIRTTTIPNWSVTLFILTDTASNNNSINSCSQINSYFLPCCNILIQFTNIFLKRMISLKSRINNYPNLKPQEICLSSTHKRAKVKHHLNSGVSQPKLLNFISSQIK